MEIFISAIFMLLSIIAWTAITTSVRKGFPRILIQRRSIAVSTLFYLLTAYRRGTEG